MNHNIHLLVNKLEAASTNRSSPTGILSSPQRVQAYLYQHQLCLSGIRITGEEDIQVARGIATQWEDAMFHDFPSSFLNILYPHLCFSGVFFSLNHPYLERVCCHGGFSCNLKADQRKWDPCRSDLAFQQVLLVFPFHGPTPQLVLVEQRHLLHIPFFDCLSIRHWNGSLAFNSSRRLLHLSHVHL